MVSPKFQPTKCILTDGGPEAYTWPIFVISEGTMPIITVEAIEGRSLEQKRELAKAITQAVSEIYLVTPDRVHIVIHDSPRENIANGGVLVCDK